MEKMSTVEMQIAERARKYPCEALTNLHQFIDEPMLINCFNGLNKKGASGVDRETWYEYNDQRSERIPQLHAAFKSGEYRAPNIRTTDLFGFLDDTKLKNGILVIGVR